MSDIRDGSILILFVFVWDLFFLCVCLVLLLLFVCVFVCCWVFLWGAVVIKFCGFCCIFL